MHFSNFVAAISEKRRRAKPRNVIHSPRRSVFGSILWWKSRVVIHSDFMRGREYAERLIKDGTAGTLSWPCGQSLMKLLPGALTCTPAGDGFPCHIARVIVGPV